MICPQIAFMKTSRKQRREALYHKVILRGHPMAFPCSPCARAKRQCVVSQDSPSCAECARRGTRCDFDRSQELTRLEAEQQRLYEAALAAEAEFSQASAEEESARSRARESLSRAHRLRRQVDFLAGRCKTLTQEELQSLEASSFLDSSGPAAAGSPPARSPLGTGVASPTFSELLNESLFDRGESPLQRP
jgi:hypothetical protein